jgi:hypothetical protein
MDIFTVSHYIISTTLVIFLLIDAVLLYVINRYGKLINNDYFNFHKKYGILKIEIFKLIIAAFLIYDLHNGTIKSGAILSITVAFCVYVLILLKDFIKQKKNAANSVTEPEQDK